VSETEETEKPNMPTDPFREFAAAMRSRTGFDATMLAFKKGIWVAGKDAVEMNNEELIALVDQSMFGWCKWVDKKPVDYHVGFVRDRYKPPPRIELGDTDPTRWERRDSDPWQLTFFLPLADSDTGKLYIFSTTSRGGRDALADLQEAYADHEDGPEDAGKQPLVALSAGYYGHGQYGRVETPSFKIVGWAYPPDNIKSIRPPASAALAVDHVAGATPQIERRSWRDEPDDGLDIPY
jgi:hypothetical protein